MLSCLNQLGVSSELQAFFKISGDCFSYGEDTEEFTEEFHRVPVTEELWIAGAESAGELIITSCAMESVAYLALNAFRYQVPAALLFISVGNLPHPRQFERIRKTWQKRKITLVFSNDLTGRIADIVVAAGIRARPVSLKWSGGKVLCHAGKRMFTADPGSISLNTFEKAAGIRTRIRTRKPNIHNTYLDQLLYDKHT